MPYFFMFTDIVFPKDNENEFVAVARELGTNSLCFNYLFSEISDPEKFILFVKELKKQITLDNPEMSFFFALTANLKESNSQQFLQLKKAKIFDFYSHGFFKGVRLAAEKSSFVLLFGIESSFYMDFNFQRNSGLDHIIAKIISDKKKVYGINFHDFLMSEKKHIFFARIEQNLRLCRKFNAKVCLFSGATNPWEMRSYNSLRAFIDLFDCDDLTKKRALEFFV